MKRTTSIIVTALMLTGSSVLACDMCAGGALLDEAARAGESKQVETNKNKRAEASKNKRAEASKNKRAEAGKNNAKK